MKIGVSPFDDGKDLHNGRDMRGFRMALRPGRNRIFHNYFKNQGCSFPE